MGHWGIGPAGKKVYSASAAAGGLRVRGLNSNGIGHKAISPSFSNQFSKRRRRSARECVIGLSISGEKRRTGHSLRGDAGFMEMRKKRKLFLWHSSCDIILKKMQDNSLVVSCLPLPPELSSFFWLNWGNSRGLGPDTFFESTGKGGQCVCMFGVPSFLTFLTQGLRGPRNCFYIVCTLLLVVR